MYKIFYAILVIIWVIDVFNIDFIINGVHVAEFLDTTVAINFWAWFIIWLLLPTAHEVKIKYDR